MSGSVAAPINSAKVQSASGLRQFVPLTWLALGTFATGTESFMIAALLPGLARDLFVTLTAAGQLVTVFGLTYAISSPALSALTAGVGRRNLLLISMTTFALANFFASTTTDFWQLLAARILLAAAAGLYVPSASALAGAIVAPERRGTALAIVNGGTSIAVALGVPLGAIVGHTFGWRMTFIAVAIMASIAVAGLSFGIPRGIDKGLSAPSIRERLAVIRQAPLLVGFLVTVLWATGAHLFHTLPHHRHPHRWRPRRNGFLHLGRVGGYRLVLGRHAERQVWIARGDDPGICVLDAVLCRAIRDRLHTLRQQRTCPRRGGNRDLGTGCVGVLSGTAIAVDAGRGTEDRANSVVAQCLVYVPGLLARRDARVARSLARAGHDTRPHRRAL
jgi:Major Facilitator Superfamily